MLDTIPSWAVKLQHPIEIRVQWNVMGLTVGILEAEGKKVFRKANSPCVEYLGDECLMGVREFGVYKPVGTNSLSNGEDHVP